MSEPHDPSFLDALKWALLTVVTMFTGLLGYNARRAEERITSLEQSRVSNEQLESATQHQVREVNRLHEAMKEHRDETRASFQQTNTLLMQLLQRLPK